MRAAVFEQFKGPITIQEVVYPKPSSTGIVLEMKACGICRSDWHGWMGNDREIRLPHVPGHELSGVIAEVGSEVRHFRVGERVTLPFVCGCGMCDQCVSGNEQVCDLQFQPGFTGWGGFAEYVMVEYADTNLVRLPEEIDFVTAASLGCRFATSYRAVVDQGKVTEGQWVAVHGCGGVGLSAIMIARAFRARVIAVDIADDKLEFAKSVGAEAVVNSSETEAIESILDITEGGAHLSLDAFGHPDILVNSINSLRKRGKHIQVGIMEKGQHRASVPADKVIGRELEILGSHGMQAHRYPEMLDLIKAGKLQPQQLIGKTTSLSEAAVVLRQMDRFLSAGITVINQF